MRKILEYLFYKIYMITRLMDDRGNANTHVATIMSCVLFMYYIDFIIIYRFVMMKRLCWNDEQYLMMSFGIYAILWFMIYSYYKRKYLQIMRDKKFEYTTSLWAYLFIFTPFALFLGSAFI
ncbi:putative membrane protein [Bacteroides fragilis str. S24L26]|nr:putative membrane protein [Bacteroides fragilis str. S24L26]